MKQEYLFPSPAPPAIREAMAKAVERKEQGLEVFDFSSGNIGNLLASQSIFDKFELSTAKSAPVQLRGMIDALGRGIINSYYPHPRGLAYSPTGGTEAIRRLVAQYFREIHGIPISDVDTNRVIVTAGGQQAMTSALRSIRPGTRVLLPRWEYAPVSGILKYHNLDEVRVDVNEDLSINIGDLKKKVGQSSVFYLSMPNNPTGYLSPEDLRAVAEVLSANNGGVIWDAPYLFTILRLTPGGVKFDKEFLQEKVSEFKETAREYHESMCILSSLSKSCLIAGLRYGFAVASRQWIDNMEAIIGRENLSSPTPSFIAGTEILKGFLQQPASYEWVCDVLAGRLTILIQEIGKHLMLPGNGMFGALYVPVLTGQTVSKIFAEQLLSEYGIVTVPGEQFFGGTANAVRLSLVSVPWTEGEETWIASVKALKAALAKL
ncbi:MAG: pyridoxal phosphate-dependent aminotransferase [Chloroflexi bacterium]|nr:pyridoxal phosphate-dependent aminotransferase [Chloroflexota bacterium]